MPVGDVVGLWCYPVKSMQGVELNAATLNERGLLGDRAYAVLDNDTGHIASAKHPRKWARLFECRAAYESPPEPGIPRPPVRITLPDGATVSSAQPDIDQVLSRALGRDVSLITEAPAKPTREADRTPLDGTRREEVINQEDMALAAPPGTFFDYASVHVLTTATLDRLHKVYSAGRFEVRRFRANIVVAPAAGKRGYVENEWLGRLLRAGKGARLQVIDPCPRCVVTTLAQSDLPRDAGILRAIATHNSAASVTLAPGVMFPGVAGVYARVCGEGALRLGDTVYLD